MVSSRKVWSSNPRVREVPMVKGAIFRNSERTGSLT